MLRENKSFKNPVLLGKSGLSEVYRVTDGRTGELLTYKICYQQALAEREASLLKRIKHPLFPAYKDRGISKNRYYLTMEYICGTRLDHYVIRRGGLSQRRAVEIAIELAEGLLYLHEQPESIVYRDIKPENVLIQMDGRVRLVDIGCACEEGRKDCGMAGTRGYAAPEQFIAGERIGAESDVYGLGRLLYFMLSGKRMTEESRTGKRRWKRRYGKHREISNGLKWLINQAVQDNQQRRIPDMRTFLLYLKVYENPGVIKQMIYGRKLLLWKKRMVAFHYNKNVRKGI